MLPTADLAEAARSEDRGRSICFVSPGHYVGRRGGAELVLKYMAEEFEGKGWNISFVGGGDAERSLESSEGHRVICYRQHRYVVAESVPSMFRALRSADADVYYQRVTSLLTLVTAVFSSINDRTMIWAAAHNGDCRPFRHIRELFSEGRFRRFSLRGKLSVFTNRILTDLAYALGIWMADVRIAHTREQESILRRSFGLSSTVLYKGYPRFDSETANSGDPASLAHSGSAQSDSLVLWIANLRSWKRPEVFIELAKRLQQEERHFLIIGRAYSDSGRQSRFERQVNEVGGLDYAGYISHEAVLELLAKASLVVNTSREEGLSNVFIEAWGARTPVVTYGFNPDGIIDRYGVGAVAKTFEELCEFSAAFLEHRRTVPEGAFDRVLELFDLERHGEELRRLIDRHMSR